MTTPEPPSTDSDNPGALPVGTRLGEYELRSVIGVGGFGIVYLAFDHALEREVAIKEYMPASLATRSQSVKVAPLSQSVTPRPSRPGCAPSSTKGACWRASIRRRC